MTENPPPPSGTPEGGGATPPPPPNPYGSQPSTPPPPPQNPYASQPPPPSDPYAANPPASGQTPYGSAPQDPASTGQNPYGAEAYPVSPGGPAPVAGTQPGGLLPRFLARLVDGLILLVINVILVIALPDVVAGIIGGVIYLGYYTYMESSQGRTWGKQVMKLRVHGSSGSNPSMEEALRRNAWAALGIISGIPALGWIFGVLEFVAVIAIAVTISQDQLRRGWHDKFANTTVTKEA